MGANENAGYILDQLHGQWDLFVYILLLFLPLLLLGLIRNLRLLAPVSGLATVCEVIISS